MSIPISPPEGKYTPQPLWKDWLILVASCLAMSGSFGLGLLAGREQVAAEGPGDRMWIEQLPPEVRADPSRIGTSTEVQGAGVGENVVGKTEDTLMQVAPAATTGTYVASRIGTKFYLPTCATAKRIKEENKVWFATREDAIAAGYQPAANCKGM